MRLVLRRKGATLYAPSLDWADLLAELPEHVDLNVTAAKARSLPQLGTYFGLLNWCIENIEAISSHWMTKDQLSDYLQLEVGFVKHIAHPQPKGPDIYVRVPASKSFAECSQETFNRYFELALTRLVALCDYDPLPVYLQSLKERGKIVA